MLSIVQGIRDYEAKLTRETALVAGVSTDELTAQQAGSRRPAPPVGPDPGPDALDRGGALRRPSGPSGFSSRRSNAASSG
jgi:hypothetical protein